MKRSKASTSYNQRWRKGLLDIARNPEPSAVPSPNTVYMSDEHTYTIYDGFEKAKYHFLVLPRLPYRLAAIPGKDQALPTLKTANGKLNFGASATSNTVPVSHLHSVSTLLASPYAAKVLADIRTASDQVISVIQQQMMQEYGTCWEIQRAFHAVPSMDHLHLHIISMDLVSDRLKNKKHYYSFHPERGYALSLDYIQALVQQGATALPHTPEHYHSLLNGPLQSHHTGQEFQNLPQLKLHLLQQWQRHIAKAQSDGTPPPGTAPARKKVKPSSSPTLAHDPDVSDQDSEPTLPLK